MSLLNEKLIARHIITQALAKHWTVSVYDGEELCLTRSDNVTDIIDAMWSTDGDELIFQDLNRVQMGWVRFIYGNGNDGLDVVSDFTTSLEWMWESTKEVIDSLEKGELPK